MFENIFPYFVKGRILKKEALEYLRDYPREMSAVFLENYSNGIVKGFPVRYENGNIFVGTGLLKHKHEFYLLREEIVLPCQSYSQECSIRLTVGQSKKTSDFFTKQFQIELILDRKLQDGEYELGKFCLERGAVLRVFTEYKDFQDAETPDNTLKIIEREYAGRESSTIAPFLLQYYAREVLRTSDCSGLDGAFCMLCLNSERIERETILHYLSTQGQPLPESAGNMQIYHKLLELWNNRRNGKEAAAGSVRRSSRRTEIW